MPTLLRIGGHPFFFYSRETHEPPHIHVQTAEKHAKFWLAPVHLARSYGYTNHELHHIERIIHDYQELFQEAWNDYFNA